MNISYKKIVGEAGVIDRDTAAKWMNNILPDFIKDYEEHDIFIVYRMLNRTVRQIYNS